MTDGLILISGPGGSGKSWTANWLSSNTEYNYQHPTSWYAAEKMYWELIMNKLHDYPAKEWCPKWPSALAMWQDRQQHRELWAEWIKQYNYQHAQSIQLYQDAYDADEDILDGIRKIHELEAVCENFRIILKIWIDNDRVPPDPTLEYGPERCDIRVANHGSLEEYADRLTRLTGCFL